MWETLISFGLCYEGRDESTRKESVFCMHKNENICVDNVSEERLCEMCCWGEILSKSEAREEKNENEVKRNVNVNECVAADGCCYCECGVLEKYWYFSDFIIVRMLFIFRKTYNKNTFLLRWFIAFICLNGRYFGDYIHTLMCCRCYGMMKKKSKSIFISLFSSLISRASLIFYDDCQSY